MSDLWNGLKDLFIEALSLLHSLFSFIGDEPAWGFAIIALTIVVRVFMLPLAIKQTRSMRSMQELQPQIKAIQKKYKADREMLRKDPERYKAQRQKMNQELTALYQDSGVNPMGGCLPLLLQAPIFFALFVVLARTPVGENPTIDALLRSDFYFLTPSCNGAVEACGLAATAMEALIPGGILLIVLMAGSMFWAQRQMLARTAAEGPQLQQQKVLMYVMPVFLAVISFQFPMGVLLYWATTNLWQVAQQAVILREVRHAAEEASEARGKGSQRPASGGAPGPSKGQKGGKASPPEGQQGKGQPGKGQPGKKQPPAPGTGTGGSGKGKPGTGGNGKRSSTPPPANGKASRPARRPDHLPSRRSRRDDA